MRVLKAGVLTLGVAGLSGISHAQCQVGKFADADGAFYGNMGGSSAISGDHAVIGASGTSPAGACYFLDRTNGAWGLSDPVTPPEAADSAKFGASVDIDGAFAVIGAPGDKVGNVAGAGAAYCYRFVGGQWTKAQRLSSPDGTFYDSFGSCVAISGDLIAVGTPDESGDGLFGSVYLFHWTGANWDFVQKLTVPGATDLAQFGMSVAVDGGSVLVGAPGDTGKAIGAYLFSKQGNSWVLSSTLDHPNGPNVEYLGERVDLDGGAAILSAPYNHTGGAYAGAAYVFRFRNGGWEVEDFLIAPDASEYAEFGHAVALRDGLAVVGAWTNGPGKAYVFRYDGTDWGPAAAFTPAGLNQGARFGSSVATDGQSLLAGASDDFLGGFWTIGSVFLYSPGLELKEFTIEPSLLNFEMTLPGMGVHTTQAHVVGDLRLLLGGTCDELTTVQIDHALLSTVEKQIKFADNDWYAMVANPTAEVGDGHGDPGDAAPFDAVFNSQDNVMALDGDVSYKAYDIQGAFDYQDIMNPISVDVIGSFHDDPTGKVSLALDYTYGYDLGLGKDNPSLRITGTLEASVKSACYADCDRNGGLDLFDFLCYVNEFNAGEGAADCDASGGLDLFDFLCFVNAFNKGC